MHLYLATMGTTGGVTLRLRGVATSDGALLPVLFYLVVHLLRERVRFIGTSL